jgi:hypothetical protein
MSKMMTKKEKKVLIQQMSGQVAPNPKRKRARRRGNGRVSIPSSMPPARNGAGRRRGQRRQRGGKSSVTTFGNTRNFTIPIDEDIATINGSTGFSVGAVSINPGNVALLPFISRVAQNYERYEFKNLKFEYRPSASVFATVGAQGLVGIAATMDAVQVVPSTQAQADVLFHSPIVETARPTSLSLPRSFMQCKSAREKFFVRQDGFIPGGTDPHSYDCGQVFFWTNGQANANPIGTLRVVGSCELSNPASDLSTGFAPNFKVALFSVTNGSIPVSGSTQQVPFNTVVTNPVGITTQFFGTATVFTLPQGNWLVDTVLDIDITGVNSTGALIVSSALIIVGGPAGGSPSPPITSTNPGPSATNTAAFHAMTCQNWFVQSNGATTVQLNYNVTYPAGVGDVDASIRFTAI